jgi:hypothetical protein
MAGDDEHFAPAVQRFGQEREAAAPPPERVAVIKRGRKPYSRKSGVHRGSDVLKTSQVCCATCPFLCCKVGFDEAQTTVWRQQLRDARAISAVVGRAFLHSLMCRVAPSASSRRRFKSRKKLVKGGTCSWCSTVAGGLAGTLHRYTQKQCPQFMKGQKWLDEKIIKVHQYFMPPCVEGRPRQRVSLKYWTKVFEVYPAALSSLQRTMAALTSPMPER